MQRTNDAGGPRPRAPRSALLLGLVLAASASAQGTGTIAGTLRVPKASEIPNVVIHLTGIQGDFKPPDRPAEMTQHGLAFIPRVLPILRGTTVNFLNMDPILHDVFSPDPCAERLNLGTWPKDVVRSFCFTNPGCKSVLLCNVHPGMEAHVLVLDHPYFTKPKDDGSYTLSGVPAGKQSIRAWHKKYKGKETSADVKAGATVTVDLDL